MEPEQTIPPQLWRTLDGYNVNRGFGRACPSCKQEYDSGERVLVTAERPPNAAGWEVTSVVCLDCGREAFPEDEADASVGRALVSVEIVVAGMTLALDGESARVLDRSPASETD